MPFNGYLLCILFVIDFCRLFLFCFISQFSEMLYKYLKTILKWAINQSFNWFQYILMLCSVVYYVFPLFSAEMLFSSFKWLPTKVLYNMKGTPALTYAHSTGHCYSVVNTYDVFPTHLWSATHSEYNWLFDDQHNCPLIAHSHLCVRHRLTVKTRIMKKRKFFHFHFEQTML